MPATSSTICIGSAYCRRNARHHGSLRACAKRLGPNALRRSCASAVLSPRWRSTFSVASASVTESVWKAGTAGAPDRSVTAVIGASPCGTAKGERG